MKIARIISLAAFLAWTATAATVYDLHFNQLPSQAGWSYNAPPPSGGTPKAELNLLDKFSKAMIAVSSIISSSLKYRCNS